MIGNAHYYCVTIFIGLTFTTIFMCFAIHLEWFSLIQKHCKIFWTKKKLTPKRKNILHLHFKLVLNYCRNSYEREKKSSNFHFHIYKFQFKLEIEIDLKEKSNPSHSHFHILHLHSSSQVLKFKFKRNQIFPVSYLSIPLPSRTQVEISNPPISSCQTVSEVAIQQSCHLEQSEVSIWF